MIRRIASDYHLSSWEMIRRKGRSPAFASIVFFPIIITIVSLNSTLVILPIIGARFQLPLWAAAKLYVFLAGVAALSLGSSLYAWRCPEFFKRYENSIEYIKSEGEILRLVAPHAEVVGLCERRLAFHRPEIQLLHARSVKRLEAAIKQSREVVSHKALIDPQIVAELLQAHWLFMSPSWGRTRAWVTLSYIVGLVLITVATLAGFGEVIFHLLVPSVE